MKAALAAACFFRSERNFATPQRALPLSTVGRIVGPLAEDELPVPGRGGSSGDLGHRPGESPSEVSVIGLPTSRPQTDHKVVVCDGQ